MTKDQFKSVESYMLECMVDYVHDESHIYRVLNFALRIAETLPEADKDVVILSALLHDIGRRDEAKNKVICHAVAGSEEAYQFLVENGWSEKTAKHVSDCILTHRYKAKRFPTSLEAKIMFDADKLDLTGAMGVARAILFGGQIGEPFYLIGGDGMPTNGDTNEEPSLYRQYNRLLRFIGTKFYTKEATRIAQEQQQIMDMYFQAMFQEVGENYTQGKRLLKEYLTD